MKKEAKQVEVLIRSEENPYYLRYLKKRDKLISRFFKKLEFKNKLRKRSFYKEEFLENLQDEDEYFFLCYITRKYFRDNIFIYLFQLVSCIMCVMLAFYTESHLHKSPLKGPLMVILVAYGFFHGGLSILYIFAHLYCLLRYSKFVSNSQSALAQKIRVFYGGKADDYTGSTYVTQLKLYKKASAERKRLRGW